MSPPAYDPNATGSRRTRGGSGRGRNSGGIGTVADGEDGSGGAASVGRVVTVDVYGPTEEGAGAVQVPVTSARGRDKDGRRGDSGGGSRRTRRSPAGGGGGGRGWNQRSSSGPLVEIMMSSPSASPTPSRSPVIKPTPVAELVAPSPLDDDVEFGPVEWSWEGEPPKGAGVGDAAGTKTGGAGAEDALGRKGKGNASVISSAATVVSSGGAATASAAPAVAAAAVVVPGGSPVAPNSLMVATDSLGNVRIYAKQALLKALNVSAFSM